jgi:hypothetical protein
VYPYVVPERASVAMLPAASYVSVRIVEAPRTTVSTRFELDGYWKLSVVVIPPETVVSKVRLPTPS